MNAMEEHIKRAVRQWTVAQPVVSAFVASIVRDFAARDDVMQEIAVAVFESYPRYDETRPFITWALGIAQRQIGLYLRRTRRDRLVFDDDTVQQLASAFERTSDDSILMLEHLRDCVAKLDGRAREICDHRYRLDRKPKEIAANLKMQPNTVAKVLQRIREQLRDCVQARYLSAASPVDGRSS